VSENEASSLDPGVSSESNCSLSDPLQFRAAAPCYMYCVSVAAAIMWCVPLSACCHDVASLLLLRLLRGSSGLSPAVWLQRFQLLERKWSSGDNTVIDKDKVKGIHTHTSGVRPIRGMLL
jgi:hypothetical protein